ncbi:hypothetical protein BEL01nite_58480 [Bradyrhizobium elkanii]|nr:hypothetical protein BEL01nite_58480 [Bradyrhizobium elkanii]
MPRSRDGGRAMEDEELLLQAANAPTMYFDGFGAFRKINGVLRCVGYVLGSGAQLNVIVSLTGAEAANAEARRVLEEKNARSTNITEQMRVAH